MVVPVGKKVRVITTAADVIHAWWVPALGVKQDAIPGFVRDTWFKADKIGTYRGQCAELCGKEHGFMPIVVEVVSPDDYAKWVGEQKKAMAAAGRRPEQGWTLAELVGARREGLRRELRRLPPGRPARACRRAFPALAGIEDRDRRRRAGTDRHRAERQAGHRDGAVASSCPTPRSPRSITYARNSWGNKASDVQPAEVKAARK